MRAGDLPFLSMYSLKGERRRTAKCRTTISFLTTKDFTILEVLRDRHHDQTGLLMPLIRNKMEKAIVVFREDLPSDIASINSRVRFRVAAGESDTRVISTGQTHGPVGMFLPITTFRGLALLGLREGQTMSLVNMNGVTEKIVLEKVEYQPEASRREREALGQDLRLGENRCCVSYLADLIGIAA